MTDAKRQAIGRSVWAANRRRQLEALGVNVDALDAEADR